MVVRIANANDLQALCHFYQDVCHHQHFDEYSPKWTWQDYPSQAGIEEHIEHDHVFINVIKQQIAGAGIISIGEDPDYQHVPWQHQFNDQEIAILHLFAVNPEFRGHGVAKETLSAMITWLKKNGQKVIHLDILDPNLPAEKAYQKAGFALNNQQIINYQDIGPTPAKLFEYLI